MDTSSHRWIPPTAPRLVQQWDADGHVYGLEEIGPWMELGEHRARFREGVRMPAADAWAQGLYRPSSIRGLCLHADTTTVQAATARSAATEVPAVAPGDIVLSKFLPVRAAWVAPATTRRGVDANCVRICGLEPEVGFWVANVLEHPRYQRFLARLAQGAALPRVSLRDLKALRLPLPPLAALSPHLEAWSTASDELASARREIAELQADAEAVTRSEGPEPVDETVAGFHPPGALTHHSWAPGHLALERFLGNASTHGWTPLANLIYPKRARLRDRRFPPHPPHPPHSPHPPRLLRLLRMSDVDENGDFEVPEPQELKQAAFRVYAEPLRRDEVLLSVLGSAPKVVFHHPGVAAKIHLPDPWIRLEAPDAGALALLLRTSAVTWQLRIATTGAWRQFVSRAEIGRVRIPRVDPAKRYEWHDALSLHLEQIAEARRAMDEIRARVAELVERCMGGER